MKLIKEKSGFSLAGTVVVLTIIGVMTTIAIPNLLEWLPAKRVNGAIRNLAVDMQWTRMKAVADNNDYVICFDTIQNTYSIYEFDNCPTVETPQTPEKRVNISAEYPGIIICDVNFSKTEPPRLIFRPTGRPVQWGHVYLIPEEDIDPNRKDRFKAITVIQTGFINIKNCSEMDCSGIDCQP